MIITGNSKVLYGHVVGIIMLAIDDIDSIKADVLVMDSQLLNFDLFNRMDIIKILDGVNFNKFNEAIFSMMPLHCNQSRRT